MNRRPKPQRRGRSRRQPPVTGVAATLLAVLVAVGAAAEPARAANPVPQRPQQTASFNGEVHAVATTGASTFVGGEFTAGFHDGSRRPRHNLAAVHPDGGLRPFAPRLDGPVYALAADGDHLYVGGRFRDVDGTAMRGLARFRRGSGQLDTGFRVSVSAEVRALAIGGGRLYLGGRFSTVNGRTRHNLAAVDLSDGDLVPGFAPDPDRSVRTLHLAHGRLYLGGTFTEVDGDPARKLAAVDPATGALNNRFRPEPAGAVFDIEATGKRVYAAVGGPGGRLAAHNRNGRQLWEHVTDGDVQAVTATGGVIYGGGHFDKACTTSRTGTNGTCLDGFTARGKLFATTPGGELLDWHPDADSAHGVLGLDSADGEVAAGGAFRTFADRSIRQQAFARF